MSRRDGWWSARELAPRRRIDLETAYANELFHSRHFAAGAARLSPLRDDSVCAHESAVRRVHGGNFADIGVHHFLLAGQWLQVSELEHLYAGADSGGHGRLAGRTEERARWHAHFNWARERHWD